MNNALMHQYESYTQWKNWALTRTEPPLASDAPTTQSTPTSQ